MEEEDMGEKRKGTKDLVGRGQGKKQAYSCAEFKYPEILISLDYILDYILRSDLFCHLRHVICQ